MDEGPQVNRTCGPSYFRKECSMIDIDAYIAAVDEVCIQCHYVNAKTCKKCPVRKTVDEKFREQGGKK